MPESGKKPSLGFKSIGHKLTAMIGATISVGFISIVFFYTQQQERNILLQNERTVRNLTQSVNEGLQTVMITGSADVAELFAERLKGVKDVTDFRILRLDGVEAFHDNDTIKEINDYRGEADFDLRPTESPKKQVIKANDPYFRQAIESEYLVHYYDQRDQEKLLTFLLPIKTEKRCHRCHGKEKKVIGVLEFTTSLDSVDAVVQRTRILSAALLVAILAIVLVVTRRVLKKAIIRPLDQVSQAMQRVSAGDLDQLVPVIGKDELGRMADSFNRMTTELKQTYQGFQTERNKLETIIMGSNEGMVVTNSAGKIVLINQAAEMLLGKSSATITEGGLLALFDDPERMRSRIEGTGDDGQPPEIILFNERFLAVYATSTRDQAGKVSGHAVLIRDMTEEKTLEKMLQRLSNADALTGLFNRRYLDESLALEFERAHKSGRPMSVLMFDIDHFKKFNDTYGHDQGDRVLKAFAHTTLECVRNLDIACRYGGEEFMVIATETSQDGAFILAERIRQAVAAMKVDGLSVTTSIGVAGILETRAESPAELADFADMALYRAKEGGRNRTVLAEALP